MSDTNRSSSVLQRLPLHSLHFSRNARMVPFAGYEMPLHYASGLMSEHRHTRSAAGLFDVSHMGQILVRPRQGNFAQTARALEALIPGDIVDLKPGRQRYALLTNDQGGVHDDIMIANLGSCLLLIVNAASKRADEMRLRASLENICTVEVLEDRALLALQGPLACAALARRLPAVQGMRFMDVQELRIAGGSNRGCSGIVSRSGYTGEDGFEISLPIDAAFDFAEFLMEQPEVKPTGLGARDSLRLEAGLCLCGNELGPDTTPLEAGLDWVIPRVRRQGGSRAGGFCGDKIILDQLEWGAARRRVGLKSPARPVREGTLLYPDENTQTPFGSVTSGTFSPTLVTAIAMGYLPKAFKGDGTRLVGEVRGTRIPLSVCELPFVPHRYHRTVRASGE